MTPIAAPAPNPRETAQDGGTSLRLDDFAKQAIETSRTRLLTIGALFLIVFTVISARLVDVTLMGEGYEPRLAVSQGLSTLKMERADILDRNGVLLATSLTTASLYANPRQILDADEATQKLTRLLPGLKPAKVLKRLSTNKSFIWIKRNLTPRQQYDINALGIPGLYFQHEESRVYPHGRLASHVLGFTDIDNHGLAGIEHSMDANLRESSQAQKLTLDIRIQHILHEELSRAVETHSAVGGAGAILDVRNGEVIALVSLPDFDPNQPSKIGANGRFNRATLGVYEMGSTFKIFTTAMALESGVATMKDGYDATDPIRIARFTIRDHHAKERWLSVPEILIYSSNIGAAKMALDVGTAVQRGFLDGLGLLKPSPIELPEVGTPMVPSPWRDINTMTIAYGHGLAVSPLQLVSGIAAVVNGGALHPATLLYDETNGNPLKEGTRVVSAKTSEQIRRLMRLVVEKGTGKKAAARGYLVGGKTGTAEKSAVGGYANKALLSSFVSAFPMNDPRYVVFIMVDEPKGTEATFGYATGGWVAAPAVRRVVRRMGPLLGITPVNEEAPEIRNEMLVNIHSRVRNLASF